MLTAITHRISLLALVIELAPLELRLAPQPGHVRRAVDGLAHAVADAVLGPDHVTVHVLRRLEPISIEDLVVPQVSTAVGVAWNQTVRCFDAVFSRQG